FLVVGVSFLPFIPTALAAYNYRSIYFLRYIPIRNFEMKSGIRKDAFLLIPLYIACFAFYQYPSVTMVMILLFTLYSTTLYSEGESRQMLEVFQLNSSKFLILKVKNQLLDFWIICLPLILMLVIVQYQYWYILLVLVLIS